MAGISWYHSIDLGGGVVTPGNPPDGRMRRRASPGSRGRTVLDIGAWDGFWSFEAEARGASRVVAMDHYAWSVDFAGRLEYWERASETARPRTTAWTSRSSGDPDEMPGRAGFDLAHRAHSGSSVEPVLRGLHDRRSGSRSVASTSSCFSESSITCASRSSALERVHGADSGGGGR